MVPAFRAGGCATENCCCLAGMLLGVWGADTRFVCVCSVWPACGCSCCVGGCVWVWCVRTGEWTRALIHARACLCAIVDGGCVRVCGVFLFVFCVCFF